MGKLKTNNNNNLNHYKLNMNNLNHRGGGYPFFI